MEIALRYELSALNTLLENNVPDEVNVADFYKFAAGYALELGRVQQAAALLSAALKRDPPEKLRRELLGLLKDVKQESNVYGSSEETSMRILWVENNTQFADVTLQTFLVQHSVTVVPSLAQAKEHLAKASFDVVMLDYDLDDGKGTELVPTLRALAPPPPIIATSSHAGGNSKLVEAGVDHVCSKMEFNNIGDMLEAVWRAGRSQ